MDPHASTLLPKLIARCTADLEAMRTAVAAGDLQVVEDLGHRMAGACGSFGLHDLAEVGRDLQRAAAAGDAQAVAPALDRLAHRLRDLPPAPEKAAAASLGFLHVLLLEDDPLQQELAATWLRDAGHVVTTAGTAREAMRVLERQSVDLAVFDWNLPDLAGDELLRWVRERQRRLPVMFATARDEESEVASILRLGADDYVVKPLRRLEFVARVEALGRRAGLMEGTEDTVLEVGPYRLDRRTRSIALDGQVVKMTPRMTEVALLLFRKRGELVSRSQLYEQVWGHRDHLDTRSVDTHVSRLRQALELDGRHGWRLVAVYQHGYRLEESAEDPRERRPKPERRLPPSETA